MQVVWEEITGATRAKWLLRAGDTVRARTALPASRPCSPVSTAMTSAPLPASPARGKPRIRVVTTLPSNAPLKPSAGRRQGTPAGKSCLRSG